MTELGPTSNDDQNNNICVLLKQLVGRKMISVTLWT